MYTGAFAKFHVSPQNGHVRFQNLHNPSRFLAIRDGVVTYGTGGPFCEFMVNTIPPTFIGLRSAVDSGEDDHHAGANISLVMNVLLLIDC
jgi:hypothetical protein